MKAITQDRYGSTDVLSFADIDTPTPGAGEVLVRVHAAGVDPGVWHLMTGLPYAVRLVGYGLRVPKVAVRGRDLAGTVEAVGAGVTRFKAGDEVFGTAEGTFAEYVCAREDRLAAIPANLRPEQAAAVPISGMTALQGLRDRVEPGHHVLVIGAAGGVGTYAVQLAKVLGAEVTGVCSTGKVDLVKSIGADHVIDYTRSDCVDGSVRYDLILDIAGNRPLSRLRGALTPKGTLVVIGGEGGGKVLGMMGRVLGVALVSPFVKQSLRSLISVERVAHLEALRELIEAGTVMPVLDRTFPLSDAAAAIDYVQSGQARGKVVLAVS
ncbi:NAD(P)-dependent alcohol dehydrogenase [Actinokineospora sp. HUAS TT18]|uniref:NAD(P)-dependent alcohol dehydrogenase n=1 Tax=Actinokineospora sp. HUAS TT18 TaxID=3447451 RepID=UPI003F526E99